MVTIKIIYLFGIDKTKLLEHIKESFKFFSKIHSQICKEYPFYYL